MEPPNIERSLAPADCLEVAKYISKSLLDRQRVGQLGLLASGELREPRD